jgi:hypothetical protein
LGKLILPLQLYAKNYRNIAFKKTPIFVLKMAKIAENIYHYIDSQNVRADLRKSNSQLSRKRCLYRKDLVFCTE